MAAPKSGPTASIGADNLFLAATVSNATAFGHKDRGMNNLWKLSTSKLQHFIRNIDEINFKE